MDTKPAPKPAAESPPQSPLSQVSDTRDVAVLFETPLNAEMISSFIVPPEDILEPTLLVAAPLAASEPAPVSVPVPAAVPAEPVETKQTEPQPPKTETKPQSPIIQHVVEGAPVVARQSSLPVSPLITAAPAPTPGVAESAAVAPETPATTSALQPTGFNQAQFEADMALLKQLPVRDDAAVAGVTRTSTHVGTIYHRGTGVKVRLTNTIDYVMDEENLVKLMKRGHVAVYDTKNGTLLTEYKGFKLPTIDQLITNVVEYHGKEPHRRALMQ